MTSGRTATSRSEPYQPTTKPNIGGTTISDTSDNKSFPRPSLRHVSPDQKNVYARGIAGETTSNSPPAPPPKQTSLRTDFPINSQGAEMSKPTTTTTTTTTTTPAATHPIQLSRTQEGIFENAPLYGGPVSYLGIGTFSQFEHCLHECLERERRQIGIASHIIRHDIPPNISVYDYGYDPLPASPNHQLIKPSSGHPLIDYRSEAFSTFLLDDIRNINVALSKSGISLFPYQQPFRNASSSSIPVSFPSSAINHSYYPNERRIIGEVVSACRLVEEDSPLLYDRHRSQAVQNVWNAIRHCEPFSYTDPSRSSVSPRGPYNI